MRAAAFISIFCLSGVVGCDQQPYAQIPTDYCAHVDMKTTTPPDMTVVPKCAAAKGVPGDNLICFDFSSIPDQTLTTPPPTQLNGWDFEQFAKSCWQILNGKLQVKNFSAFMGNCGFLMPAIKPSDYQKYNAFTLSVIHRVDISDVAGQSIQFMLGVDAPSTRLVTQWTGKQSRQQTVIEMAKNDLPNGGTSMYQPLFKLSVPLSAGATAQGWQIESIAINGSL